MKILLDTNIVLDLLMQREPFFNDALKIFNQIEAGRYEAFLCATTITTMHYLLTKHSSKAESKKSMQLLLKLFDIAPVDKEVLTLAEKVDFNDYEDAVIYASAKAIDIEAIITRNEKDFVKSDIPVFSPIAFNNVTT